MYQRIARLSSEVELMDGVSAASLAICAKT